MIARLGAIVAFMMFYAIDVMVDTNSTGSGVPSAAPSGFDLDSVSLTSITVKWGRIDFTQRNGFIRGYDVKYQKFGSQGDVKHLEVSRNTFRATLNELTEGTKYIIQVAGFTKDGVGVYSFPLEVETKQFDPCDSSPCLNGGTCAVQQNGDPAVFYCICSSNFTGIFCESFVNGPPCHSPNVSLPTLSPLDSSSPISIRRSNQFLIESHVILDCELSYKTAFTWSIYKMGAVETPVLSTNGTSEFRITPHLLPVGPYLVRLTVSMLGTQVFGVGQGYIQIISSPLVAVISGGTKVARGFNRSLVFDASLSYDPDEENQQSSNLNFTWLCTNGQKHSPNNSDLGGCYGTSSISESVLTVNSGLLLENSSYFITVNVTKDQRQAEYTQEVFVVPGDPPEVQIRCVDNCGSKLNPSSRTALQGICTDSSSGGILTYHWSVFKTANSTSSIETQWVEITDIQQLISTRLTSTTLVTYPGVLAPDTLYKFVFTAERPGGYPGYSEYQVTTNSPPSGGNCQVNPQSGITLVTEFTFSCSNWQDADLPLQYEFIYFSNNDLLNVVYKGQQSSKFTKLPVGDKANNLTIDFRVRVADMFGAFIEVKTPVQVLEPEIAAENLVDIAANLTTGDDSELTKLIQSGDVSRAVQLATSAIVAVDENAQTQTASQDDLTEKRIAMKSSIVQQVSAVRAETVVRVQQVANVIAQATSVISEVTIETQETATDALQAMTSVLKAESSAGESYEVLFDGARSLVTGLGSMLRVSSFGAKVYDSKLEDVAQGSHEYRRRRGIESGTSLLSDLLAKRRKRGTDYEASDVQQQSKARATGILHSLHDVGSTILSRTLVGEKPRKLSAGSVSLLVSREEPDLLPGSVFSSEGNSFTLPSFADMFDNDTQFVDSQMMATEFVPFSWDPSGERVTTGVSSLELKNSTGHLLNITQLKSPISIKLRNIQDLANNSRSHYVGANRTVYHKMNVTTPGMALILKVRPEKNSPEFSVFGKHQQRPSPNDNDFSTTIPDFSSCVHGTMGYTNCSRDPHVVYVDSAHVNQTGYYFIGIQIKSRTRVISRVRRCSGKGRSKRSCVQYKEPPTTGATYNVPEYLQGDENYTMQVIPAACLYWNVDVSKWTTEGCKVDETTTLDSIHCSCDHLSAFGGQLFVAPNPIDFDKVFTEFTRLPESGNVAVTVAVGCVFGLYLLLLLWARKFDKLDRLKVGARSLLGVRSPWAHFYHIEVSTGIWRKSGTTANVYIMLEGEHGASRPYHLKGDSCIPFARGSVISFTLAIPINIGAVRTVRIWHDNSGSSPAWFLNHIKVCDVSAQIQLTFMCYMWLAVDRADGLVDRTLTSASTTEKGMDFIVYVQNRIAEEFSEEHLWFSVATRSPRHRFTRVERLSCCLSLLLVIMLVSAMFYQFDEGVANTQGTLQLGRFVFNLRELIIGVQSVLVVMPLNLLIVEIFTHTTSAHEKKQSQQPTINKRQFALPHCFIYIAWLLCFLTAIGSATFAIFYSLQWGKDTSEEWVVSIGMSVFMDIFVSEPLRIIVVAFMLSHIFKAGGHSSHQKPYNAASVVDVDDIQLSELDKEEEDIEIPKPPSKKQLRRARTNRLRELHMYMTLRKIVSYILYLWILIIVCYGGRSEHGFLMTSSVSEVFGQLSMISSPVETWNWTRGVLIPGLYEDGKYFTLTSSSPYIGDGDAVLVGMPRLRQLRVKRESCQVVEEAVALFNACVASYTYDNEDRTLFYQPSWDALPTAENMSRSNLDQICPTAWRYSSAKQTQSLPFWGRLHLLCIYGQGGYLAELGYDKSTALKVISELSRLNWIDRFTSVVLVEFTVFNPGVSLFCTFTIPIEFSPSGHVVSDHVIRTMHVYDLGGGYSAVTVACQVLLVLYIIYFVVTETKQMFADIRLYFRQFLNLVELAQTITVISFVITHVLKETELFANTAKLHENIFQFISFDRSVFLDTMESVFVSLLMFFNTVKLLYLLKFNSHVNHLFDVMKSSARELLHCSLGFFIFMFTFVHFGYLQFGRDLDGYSSPFSALQTLLTEGVISEGINYFQDCCPVGRVYILALKLGLNVICINVFIAVVNENYRTVRQLSKRKFNLGLFMIRKMKEILGCVGEQQEKTEKEKRTERKTPELDVPEVSESTVKLIDDLERRTKQIKHSLNEIYADEFGDDCDFFRLWLDIHLQRVKETSKDEGGDYCALA